MPDIKEELATAMAKAIGHGISEKCDKHAEAALDFFCDRREAKWISIVSFLDLYGAYRLATTNAECAEILRLYTTDGKRFAEKFAGSYQKSKEKPLER